MYLFLRSIQLYENPSLKIHPTLSLVEIYEIYFALLNGSKMFYISYKIYGLPNMENISKALIAKLEIIFNTNIDV